MVLFIFERWFERWDNEFPRTRAKGDARLAKTNYGGLPPIISLRPPMTKTNTRNYGPVLVIFCLYQGITLSSNPFFICIYLFPSAIQIMTHKISAVSNALLNPMKMVTSAKRKSLLLWISRLFYFWRSTHPRFQEEPLPHFVLTEYGQGYLSSPSQYSRFCFAVLALAVTYHVSLP